MLERNNIRLGIAPIGWSNDDMHQLGDSITFEQCISEIALAGFQGTEIGRKFPTDPKILREALGLRGLQIASQWFSTTFCEKSCEENEVLFIKQLEFLEKLGTTRINVCEVTRCLFASKKSMFGNSKQIASDKEWEFLCTGLNRLGKIAQKHGFKLCFHHHMATVVQTVAETKRLLDNTDPEYIFLCFDTGHFTLSGEDAVEALKLFFPRIAHIHLKDIRREKMEQAQEEGFSFRRTVLEGCFTVPGDGFIDFPEIFSILDRKNYEGWLLVEAEQDPATANPFKYALMARECIRRITGI
jgi:inosose dehydratase